MSNANDRCAYDGCTTDRLHHAPHFPGLAGSHAFVEPDPMCGGCKNCEPASQPAPSGDEAKVREIARAAFDEWFGSADGDLKKAFLDVASKAFTVGLESGFRVAEDNAEISTWDGWQTTAPTIELGDARKKLADIIARRGSEGT